MFAKIIDRQNIINMLLKFECHLKRKKPESLSQEKKQKYFEHVGLLHDSKIDD